MSKHSLLLSAMRRSSHKHLSVFQNRDVRNYFFHEICIIIYKTFKIETSVHIATYSLILWHGRMARSYNCQQARQWRSVTTDE